MILFPLMISWVWFQIFTASPLVFSAPPLEDLFERRRSVRDFAGGET
jgi:hypothetical protein